MMQPTFTRLNRLQQEYSSLKKKATKSTQAHPYQTNQLIGHLRLFRKQKEGLLTIDLKDEQRFRFTNNMTTRMIYTKLWKDEFFAGLNPTEKLLFIYFITNERVNIIHCYEITEREIVFDTGIDRGIITRSKEVFQEAGKISFFNNYIFLRNADKYEKYKGEKNDSAKEKLLSLMSKDTLDWLNKIKDGGIDTPMKGSINHKSEIINQKSENRGIVKGDNKLELSTEELQEIADKYQVPFAFVLSKLDDVNNWVDEKPSKARGRNLKATLRNWVKRDAISLIEKHRGDPTKRGVDATNL